MSANGDRTTDVLIVGGGPVGLTMSVLLADLGVPSLVVERRDGGSKLPKAHYLNARTMEIFDSFGFADEVYENGSSLENISQTTWYTSLGGDEATDGRLYMQVDSFGGGSLRELYEATSAHRSGNLPQRLLEPRLRRVAQERNPGAVLFEHDCTSVSQENSGVRASIRAPDSDFCVHARYAVSADGGRTVGPALGVALEGLPPFMRATAIHFRADLAPWVQEDSSLLRMIVRVQDDGTVLESGFIGMGPTRWDRHSETWVLNVIEPIGLDIPKIDWDDELALGHLRDVLKLPELDAEILSIGGWAVESVLADRYRVGRVFFAGDAAHRHPPTTGLGLNSGVADAHNLAWKLAAVLRGHGSDQLLDTYETERRPVAARNIGWAMLTALNHVATHSGWGVIPGAPAEHNVMAFRATLADTPDGAAHLARLREFLTTQRREYQARDIELGYHYYDGGAVVPDGSDAPESDPCGLQYQQVTRPGHRLPHAPLRREGHSIGTHALLRPGAFLLLVDEAAPGWREAAHKVSERMGIAIDTIGIGDDVIDDTGRWAKLRGHDDGGAILVRPDGHVAYRAVSPPADISEALTEALSTVLRQRRERGLRLSPNPVGAVD